MALRANIYCLLTLFLAALLAYFVRKVPGGIVLVWFSLLGFSYLFFLLTWASLSLRRFAPDWGEFLTTLWLFLLLHFSCELCYLFAIMARGGFLYHLAK